MQDVFTKKFEHTEKFKFKRESEEKTLLYIKDWKGLPDVVCKSENVQKKVPYTTYLLTGKIAKIFLFKEDIERKKREGKKERYFT